MPVADLTINIIKKNATVKIATDYVPTDNKFTAKLYDTAVTSAWETKEKLSLSTSGETVTFDNPVYFGSTAYVVVSRDGYTDAQCTPVYVDASASDNFDLGTITIKRNSYSLSGNVISATGGVGAISGAQVKFTGTAGSTVEITATTADDGDFTFEKIPYQTTGTISLVSKEGYKAQEYKTGITVTEDTTLTDSIQLEPIQYTIEFDKNGATGSATVEKLQPFYDQEVTIPNKGEDWAKENYEFTSWNDLSGGTGHFYNVGATVSKLASTNTTVTLFAV